MNLIAWMRLREELASDVAIVLALQTRVLDENDHSTIPVQTIRTTNPNGLIARFGSGDHATRELPAIP